LIENRNKARVVNLNRNTRPTKAKLRHHNRLLQKRCRKLKNQWWLDKAAEVQAFVDTGNVKGFYQSMKLSGVPDYVTLTSCWQQTTNLSSLTNKISS